MRKFSWRGVPPAIALLIMAAALAASCDARPGPSTAGPSSKSSTASAGDSGAFPATVRAANGTVRIPSRPDAIISLSPTGTEMLYAIGAGRQIKAVGQYSNYPPSAPRTSLSEVTPSIEAIVARRPDLVVIDGEATRGLAGRLAGFGIPVLLLPTATGLPDVYAEISELGRATGHYAQARAEDRWIRAQLARIVASVPRHAKPLTYYYELTTDYYSVTSSTFIGRLLSLLGLKSIADAAHGAAAASGYPQLSAEAIVKADPDYVFLADTICCRQNARSVAARPGWALIKAVRERHVVGLNDDIASRWGPRIVQLLRTVAAALRHGRGQS